MPSKKTLFIALACVISFGLISFVIVNKTGTGNTKEKEREDFLVASKDDGSNPNNNLDTTLEKWQSSEEVLSNNSSPEYASGLTATDEFAQKFFAEYIQIKRSNQTLSESQIEQMVIEFLEKEDLENHKIEKTYQSSDLKTGSVDSPEAIKKYGNDVGSILIKNTPTTSENEFQILKKFAQTQNFRELSKLKVFADAYENVTRELLEIEVPPSALDVHLNFLNSTSALSGNLDGIQSAEIDPVLSVIGINNFDQSTNNLASSYRALQNYFSSNNISFSKKEPGYTFLIE